MRLAAVRAALWVSLMTAAVGLGFEVESVGWALVAGGVLSALFLFFVVDTTSPVPRPDRRDRQAPR